MQKIYIVFEFEKEMAVNSQWLADPQFFPSYDLAFNAFNELIAQEGRQIFRSPKVEKPLRAALSNCDIELWISTRTNELTTTD